MAYKPEVKQIVLSDKNDTEGLYQFVVTNADSSKCRISYTRYPAWKITSVNRLLNIPCPVCMKDYYCNCMTSFKDVFDSQIDPDQHI